MKRVSFLSFAFVILSTIITLAQTAGTSLSPPPSGKGFVGQTMEFKSTIEAFGGDYNDFQWTLSFPTNVLSAPNPPTGSPYTWTLISPNNWQTTIPKLAEGEGYEVTIIVNAIAVTSAGAEYAISQLSGYFDDDVIPEDDFSKRPFFVEASPNVITIATNNPTPITGEQVILTASGCPTGGLYQNWSPTGGAVTGTGNNTYTVTASLVSQVYTVDCSLGGQGTITVVGTAAPLDNIVGSATPPTINYGGSSTLTASGCVNPTYNWTWSGGSSTGATITVSPASTTTYTATCANAAGGTSTTTVTVTVNNIIDITTNNPNPVAGNPVILTATGCTGGTYTWSPTGGTASGGSNQTYTVNATVTSTVYTASCSTGGSSTITVVGTPAPIDNITATASPATINVGASSALTATGCVNPSYSWTWPGGSSTGATITVTPASPTTYTATCANAAGGTSSTTVTVMVNAVQCLANAGTLN